MRKGRRRTTALVTLLAGLLTVLLAVPAGANQGVTQISGSAVLDGEVCADAPEGFDDFALVMSGDLTGCLYTGVDNVRDVDGSGVYLETGRERFVGYLGDERGTFDTTYRFTAKFNQLGEEIHGRCQHPITEGTGTGGFAGITGRLDFKDDVDAGIFYYRGHLRI